MTHPLVLQLRFTRSEFKRALQGVEDGDAQRIFPPMNCISWCIGHIADQEQRYWLRLWRGELPFPQIHELFAYGAPACTPELEMVLSAWHTITTTADPWLDTLTSALLSERQTRYSSGGSYTIGSLLQRVIYHYWYHTGEIMAIRQLLGHLDLPEFVGNIDDEAPYLPE
jgi:uncharacterized damage-inducible protein DinB